MALTSHQRSNLSDKQFALPGRRYPIPDETHARNALARVAQFGTPEEQATVRASVAKKYPGVEQQSNGNSAGFKKRVQKEQAGRIQK